MKKNDSKKKKQKDIYINICPKCKSPHVRRESSINLPGVTPDVFVCNKCGHSGYTFPQMNLAELDKIK